MNISSKNDKGNIQKIEDLRDYVCKGNDFFAGGLVLYIDARAVEIVISRQGLCGEHTRARLIQLAYNDAIKDTQVFKTRFLSVESDYLTAAEIYNAIKASINSYIERGF